MISPLHGGRELRVIDSVASTQEELSSLVLSGKDVGAVLAMEQTAGKGRQGREWYSPRGECLALSIALWEYENWATPQYLGMAIAIAAANAFDTHLRWPNDLVLNNLKVGGVLGEVTGRAHVPIIGLGVNLRQTSFPRAIAKTATSLVLAGRESLAPEDAASRLLDALALVPEPTSWSELADLWQVRDATAGKHYRLPDERLAIAERVGDDGRLVARVGDEVVEISVADAL